MKGDTSMKIYVVEAMADYTVHYGLSTNKEVAERKAKELSKQVHRHCWVTEYTLDKDNWSDFEND